jgi:dihydrodipicolinate synthase/N-acetylneuraminate lyase
MLELAAYAEQVGADAISAVPPLFYKYDNDGIYAYYKRLCESVKIPVVIYNNPNTGVSFGIDLLERLFSIPNLTSIKWTNSDFFTVLRLKERVPEANVINGPDEMLAMGLAAGCDACIGTTYNFQLPIIKAIYNAFKENRPDEARELQMKADKIIGALISRNTIMATKLLMDRMGYDVYHAVFPMQKFSPEVEELQLKELRDAGFEF